MPAPRKPVSTVTGIRWTWVIEKSYGKRRLERFEPALNVHCEVTRFERAQCNTFRIQGCCELARAAQDNGPRLTIDNHCARTVLFQLSGGGEGFLPGVTVGHADIGATIGENNQQRVFAGQLARTDISGPGDG